MKQAYTFVLMLVPALAILWWHEQPPPASQTPVPVNIPVAKIAVIDSNDFGAEGGIQQLLQQRKLLDEKYKPSFEEYQKLQKEFEALQQEIQTKGANWTIEVQRKKQDELEEKQTKSKRLSEDLQRKYQKDLQRATAPISERVRTYMQQYASRRGITMLLDVAPLNQAGAVPYLDPALDVTQDFINEYNKAYPATQSTPPPPSK